ncbi:hypothetical protein Sdia_13720 [Streptomyces diastaticus subsp. diastaticus]|uniref:Uncharacterized protein n=1 Tax=Streptomyces diastaticus subsp. diastaticus TaxID=68040 RepID=A0ABQ1CJJ4_STRDI|nr:hypothetical protein Sdia_13720 [Streptomyces diastaticus subsp. diastaticus]GGU34665.1 hypothetical protein GCM10015534_41460 [Streptomyces diastaticus subsp. diastaticus]
MRGPGARVSTPDPPPEDEPGEDSPLLRWLRGRMAEENRLRRWLRRAT